MDPASAIGTASAVISFINFTHQFLSTVYSIYKSTTGQQLVHQTLEDVTLHMQQLSMGLASSKPTMDQSKDEMAMSNLAYRCSDLAEKIIALLKKTQARKGKNGPSLVESLRAASKSIWTKKEVSALQQSLDQCMSLLLQQWTVLESSETRQTLRRLLKATVSDANEFASVHRILQSGVGLNRGALDNVRDIFSLSDQQLQAANQNHILKALDFDMMDERYHDVSKSASDTFQWIFNDEEKVPTDPETAIPFKKWLATGNGIFHISGKPGSGKSTLMKFLCQNEQTRIELQRWAGSKHLVFARFFFWRPGNSLQTSLLGLVRSLLFHVLAQSPGAFSSVFPQYWNPADFQPWISQPRLRIDDDEIFDAFLELIKNVDTYKDQRFCFFIDGLDEFEEKFRTYGDLVTSLIDWVDSSCGGVKICVSSREFNVFQKNLPVQQRIQLQALTRGDIENVVNQKLDKHLQELKEDNPTECEELVRQIVDKADGVFLWVVLTLKLLCDGLENQYSFADLLRKLDAIPRELKEFFRHILDMIDEADHKKAYYTLAITIEANKAKNYPGLSLLRYSFLMDLIDDPEYAKKLVPGDITSEQIRARISTAAAQLTGCCRGLLEARELATPVSSLTDIEDMVWRKGMKFTHRSIPEILESHLRSEKAPYFNDFDAVDALIHTFLAVVKCVEFEKSTQDHHIHNSYILTYDYLHGVICAVRDSQAPNKAHYFESLDVLNTALTQKQLELWPTFSEARWSQYTSTRWSIRQARPLFISVPHIAIDATFHEYLKWRVTRYPQELEGNGGIELLQAASDFCIIGDDKEANLDELEKCMEELLQRGVDANCVPNDLECEGLTLWAYHFIRASSVHNGFTAASWKAVEVFLRHGAESISWRRNPPDVEGNTMTVEFGRRAYGLKDDSYGSAYWKPSEAPGCLTRGGGQAVLRDWVDSKEPENADKIRELLDAIELAELSEDEEENSPTELDSEGTVEVEPEKVSQLVSTDYVNSVIRRDSFFQLWDRFGQVVKSPIVPWFLFGSLSIMVFARHTWPTVANILIRGSNVKGP